MLTRKFVPLVFVAALFLVTPHAVSAQQDGRWSLGARVLYSPYSHTYRYSYLSSDYLKIEDGTGAELFVALRPSPRISWEAAVSELTFDANLSVYNNLHPPGEPSPLIGTASGDYGLRFGTLALLFHPLPGRRYEVYLGPVLGWTTYRIDIAQHREDELIYGGKIGLSTRVASSRWRAMLEYRYLQTEHETTDRDLYGSLAFPTVSLGLAYDF